MTDPAAGGLAGAGPGAAPVRPGAWQQATVVEVRRETASAKSFRLAPADPIPHMAGQHLVVRLTAPDGYTASRSYSIASAPLDPAVVELTVELLPDGEVSGYLHEVVEPGDTLEVRGPIGDVAPLVRPDVTAYLCGSAGFTAHAGGLLGAAGVPADRIRVERFGPPG